jgi:hypothetical protein
MSKKVSAGACARAVPFARPVSPSHTAPRKTARRTIFGLGRKAGCKSGGSLISWSFEA